MSEASPPTIFDRRLYSRHRERSAHVFAAHDFLHRRAMADIIDRLETVKRDFPRALFYGVGRLNSLVTPAAGVGEIVEADLAPVRLSSPRSGVIYDEERSPLAAASFDLIVSLLTLHAANDLVGALAQMRAALKPDGLLIAALFGEETLKELKRALYESEAEISGGVSPRVAPFSTVRDLGGALQRAGFAMPVVDVDNVRARYEEPAKLFADLRGMGETSCLAARGKTLSRAVFATAAAALAERGEITFDIVTLTGWAPHPSQPKPLKPGSATRSLERAIRNF
jgi:SAM-dependent methyltransferase